MNRWIDRILALAICGAVAVPAWAYPKEGAVKVAPPPALEGDSMVAPEEFADEFDEFDEINDEFAAELDAAPTGFPDPFEGLNRRTLAFNQGLERWVLDPVTSVYRFVLPGAARRSVLRFLINLDSPAVFANDLLQREWYDAGVTAGRFGINTTIGVAGFFDPAASFGLEGHVSDFGQTLALEGVPSGAYLVVPMFGPYTVRDGLGDIVDIFLRPITFFLGPVDQIFYATIYGGSSGIALHDTHDRELDMLEESSVDFYAALRNAYYQNRTAEIWARRGDHDSLATVALEYLSSEPDATAAAEEDSGDEVHAAW